MAQPKLVKDIEARVKKSGDTMTGNLTGKYFQGTWLQTTATTDLGKAPPKVAVLDNSGWIYYRTLEELRADLGIGDYVDLIYPVGSIYMSVNATNPKNLFGGTWQQIQGRFLLGMSSSYPAGSQGGEATHKLTANEMPSHTHQYDDYWTVAAASGTGRQAVKFNNNMYSSESGGLSTRSSGSGQAHNNMPPYLAVYIWKRTAQYPTSWNQLSIKNLRYEEGYVCIEVRHPR